MQKTYGQVPDRESEPLLGEPLMMGNLNCLFRVARSSPARFSKSVWSSKWTTVVSIVSCCCCSSPPFHLMAGGCTFPGSSYAGMPMTEDCNTWVLLLAVAPQLGRFLPRLESVSVLWLQSPPSSSPQGICTLSNSLSPPAQPLHHLRGGNLGCHHHLVADKRSYATVAGWYTEQWRLLETTDWQVHPDTWVRGRLQVLDRA